MNKYIADRARIYDHIRINGGFDGGEKIVFPVEHLTVDAR